MPERAFIPFAPPLVGAEEKQEVLATLDSGWLTTGPRTERFEAAVREYVGAKAAVAVNSGTAALHLALAALGIGEGDEVITSPFTFASTGHVILYQRARPVFVDVEPDTLNIDPSRIEAAITSRTRAILPVHYGGQPCEMGALLALAARHGLAVVEDAAHAIGAEYRGRRIGALGTLACFSFYVTKNITTGEGGMVVTDDVELSERIRVLSMYGISDARRIWQRYAPKGTWYYDITDLGFKYNMMDIQAALGLQQLRRLDEFIARRQAHARIYDEALGPCAAITPLAVRPYVRHPRHLYPILLPRGADRDGIIEALKERNVGTSVLFQPLHLHSFYRKALGDQRGHFPVAEDAYDRIICLPVSPKATPEEIRYVAETVRDLVGER